MNRQRVENVGTVSASLVAVADLRPLDEVARLVGVHPTTIRYYIRKGWISKPPKPPAARYQPVDLDEVVKLRREAGHQVPEIPADRQLP